MDASRKQANIYYLFTLYPNVYRNSMLLTIISVSMAEGKWIPLVAIVSSSSLFTCFRSCNISRTIVNMSTGINLPRHWKYPKNTKSSVAELSLILLPNNFTHLPGRFSHAWQWIGAPVSSILPMHSLNLDLIHIYVQTN